MKKLLQKVSNWLRSRVTATAKVKGDRLKVKNTANTYNDEKPDQAPGMQSSFSSSSSFSSQKDSPLLLLIEEFIDEHYLVRLNTLSQQYEVCERGTER